MLHVFAKHRISDFPKSGNTECCNLVQVVTAGAFLVAVSDLNSDIFSVFIWEVITCMCKFQIKEKTKNYEIMVYSQKNNNEMPIYQKFM